MNMHTRVEILGRPVSLELTRQATVALGQRTAPLLAEMELYFSCLIRKKVRFHALQQQPDAVQVTDKLWIRFHPVMTAVCGRDYEGDEPPLTDFPIQKPESFVPNWLKIDCRDGHWQGEFGFRQEK